MKGLALSRKWLKFLAWPGLALMTAGLVSGSLTGWQLLPAALLVVGVGLLLLGLSFTESVQGTFWQRRSTQAGTNAVISVIAVLAILGLLNFLGAQYSTRADLTENQLFTLAPASKQVVQQLEQPAKVVIFDNVQNAQDVQLLESYQRQSDNFSYEYIDPSANPRQAQAFGATDYGMVFLQVGEDSRLVQTVGNQGTTPTSTPERLSERQLTNALDQVINDRSLSVYFLQGHGEYPIDGSEKGLAQAASSLEDKDYTVETLNLADAQSVPTEADVVVVAGPAQEFFEAEVEALKNHLNRGNGLLLLLDPRTNVGLRSLLDDWGVVLDDRLVLDTSGSGQFVGLGPAAPIVSDYGDHPITQEFGDGRSFFPLARPLEIQEVPGVTATPLLRTNPQSRAERISAEGELSYDPNAAPDGPYVLGVALSRPLEAGGADEASSPESPEAASEARMVVIGNSSFATDGIFGQQLNGDVFLNAVNWLGGQGDETLSIRPKEVTDRRILMTPQQQVGLGIFSLLVLPVSGLGLAIVMWLRRR